jgi:ABC-type transporter Mla subunit MlaD
MEEHDLHNALFALDDAQEQIEVLVTDLRQTSKTLATLQDYLESLL